VTGPARADPVAHDDMSDEGPSSSTLATRLEAEAYSRLRDLVVQAAAST
jgi:hypothetical protein